VAAHTVKKLSGFGVHYGPIKAGGSSRPISTPGSRPQAPMRLKTFPLRERAVLIPVELVEAMKPSLVIAPALFLLAGLGGPAGFWANAAAYGIVCRHRVSRRGCGGGRSQSPAVALSSRSGILNERPLRSVRPVAVIHAFPAGLRSLANGRERLGILAWLLIIPAVTAYLAMNFTGASTYTSLSGVNREMRWALPLEISMGASGLVIWILSRLIA